MQNNLRIDFGNCLHALPPGIHTQIFPQIKHQLIDHLRGRLVNGFLQPVLLLGVNLQMADFLMDSQSHVLRRIGADDELLETIDGYTDFEQLGRAMMEEDGVRRTEFGLVRRPSEPFPAEKQEQSPQMGGL